MIKEERAFVEDVTSCSLQWLSDTVYLIHNLPKSLYTNWRAVSKEASQDRN